MDGCSPSLPSDGGEGWGEEAHWFLWIAPLLGPLPTPSSRGEEEECGSWEVFEQELTEVTEDN